MGGFGLAGPRRQWYCSSILREGDQISKGHIIRPKVKCLKWPSRGINFDPARQKCTRGQLNKRSTETDRQTTNESVLIKHLDSALQWRLRPWQRSKGQASWRGSKLLRPKSVLPPKLTPVLRRSRTGTVCFTLLPATREQHDQNCTQSH